ncbi:short-chain dehydrogenase domain-containing protein (plasmid) [Rhizobium etli 8C-3]|uniref:Short-chain dehydrogenase domain-containing protein n=1 Tax=Rhizobium etli 8C-3 TaxID=538025 RepID=A0A1L5P9V0_RHIET|nr:short-chain dehydrogenase domain-containing protein [Rhizobium etli 8C-3]
MVDTVNHIQMEEEFADEVMALFQRQPRPEEILVERVGFLHWAERGGRFDQAVEMLTAH